MEFLESRMPKDGILRITSDWQVGSVSTSTKVIDRIMEPVYERSDYRLALVGDLWDAIGPKDKRFSWDDLDMEKPNSVSQMRYVKSVLKPAAKKIISLGTGNHEAVSMQSEGDATLYMAEELHVPYGGYSALVRVNKAFEMLLWHGRPSISSTLPDPHSRRMAIKRRIVRTNRLRWPQYGRGSVKLFAQGHVNHLEVVDPDESVTMDMGYDWGAKEITNNYEQSDAAWYAVCGSAQRLFVQGRTTYAEARGYAPLALGCVDVHLKNSKIFDVEAVRFG